MCIAVLGIRGTGKSNTAAVIAEELLERQVPTCIIDTAGEYWGLKEKYEILVVGRGKEVDVEIEGSDAGFIAEFSLQKNIPVILDLSDFTLREERNKLLYYYFKSLWEEAKVQRKPYMVILEEAHQYIPQGVSSDLKDYITMVALEGRKRGLNATIVSQRISKVEKDVLTQTEVLFLHKVVYDTDLERYKDLIPYKELFKQVPRLSRGECIFVISGDAQKIKVRKRHTFHAGYTPTLKPVKVPELKQISKEIVEAIKKARKRKPETDKYKEKIVELEAKLQEREKKINELEEIVRTLGHIRVEFPSEMRISKLVVGEVAGTGGIHDIHSIQPTHEVKEVVPSTEKLDDLDNRFNKLPAPIKRHTERIFKTINALPDLEKKILAFLVDRTPNEYPTDRLAVWIGYSETTIQNRPPKRLLELGLIDRYRKADGYHYFSTLDDFVEKEFEIYMPDIGEDDLKTIQKYLKDKLNEIIGVEEWK